MQAWRQLVVIGIMLATATPAAGAPELALRVENKSASLAIFDRLRSSLSAALPVGAGPAPVGLRLTTAVAGPASRERLEGRLEARTKLMAPQLGCWRTWSRGFFLGLELGWAVASSTPARSEPSAGRRDAGFAVLARPTASVVQFGWSG